MYALNMQKSRLEKESPGTLGTKSVLGNVDMLYPKCVGIPVGHLMLSAEYPVQAVQAFTESGA